MRKAGDRSKYHHLCISQYHDHCFLYYDNDYWDKVFHNIKSNDIDLCSDINLQMILPLSLITQLGQNTTSSKGM